MPNIKDAVDWILKIANDGSHGYDQIKRWGPDYDCSSLVISALEAAGFPVKRVYGATWTGNMRSALSNAGFVDVTAFVDLKKGFAFLPGDILLKPYAHTEMVTSVNPAMLTGAHINEQGKIAGGKSGDQTGNEISTCKYYNYPWTYCFRYVEKSGENVDIDKIAREVIDGKWGNGIVRFNKLRAAGYDYVVIQQRVNQLLKEENLK